jgi:CBS domain containing-hemolysin-like protein
VVETWVLVLVLVVLVLLDLTTTAAQTAFLHASLPRLLYQREQDKTKATDSTAQLVQASIRTQSGLTLTRMIIRLLLAGSVVLLTIHQTGMTSLLLSLPVLIVAGLVLFAFEWVVDGVVLQDATGWALRLTWYTRVVTAIFSPYVRIVQLFFGGRQTILGVAGTISVTEDDLRTLVEAGPPEGQLDSGERQMIHSIFELGSTLAREIMIPRIDVVALDVNTGLDEAVKVFMETGHSRLPVYEETVDNVLGLLYAKDLLRVWQEGNQLDSLQPLLRRAYFVPEAKKVDELLAEMQKRRVHVAIVVDEYGGIAGLVTLEDIVEEIVGEIQDEYDQAEELPYELLSPGEFIFQGRIGLDDFNEITNSHIPKEEADTLAGLIYSRFGRVPTSGETLQVDNLQLTVEQVSGRRIRKVRVQSGHSLPPTDERVTNANE